MDWAEKRCIEKNSDQQSDQQRTVEKSDGQHGDTHAYKPMKKETMLIKTAPKLVLIGREQRIISGVTVSVPAKASQSASV